MQLENRRLDHLAASVIPGSILTHYLMDDGVAKEIGRILSEEFPGLQPAIDITPRLIVITWEGPSYDEVLNACRPYNREGLFQWKGETFDHKKIFLRRVGR